MKFKRVVILSVALLAVLVVSVGLMASAPPLVIGANVVWDPKSYTLDNGPPNPWNAEIWLKGGHKAQTEIDPSTILLEGLYTPSGAAYNATHGPRLVVPFDGNNVLAALLAKLQHYAPGDYKIDLIVSGKLYTGEDWQGDGSITLTIPPPPPP